MRYLFDECRIETRSELEIREEVRIFHGMRSLGCASVRSDLGVALPLRVPEPQPPGHPSWTDQLLGFSQHPMPHLRFSPLATKSLDAVDQSDATDQSAERRGIVEEIRALIDRCMVITSCSVNT